MIKNDIYRSSFNVLACTAYSYLPIGYNSVYKINITYMCYLVFTIGYHEFYGAFSEIRSNNIYTYLIAENIRIEIDQILL